MAVAALTSSIAATAREAKEYFIESEDGDAFVNPPTDVHVGGGGSAAPQFFAPTNATSVISSFEGTSDYDSRALGAALIPPDTMGAVGTTQYVELINGSFSVYSKATGMLVAARKTDSSFWQAAGGTSTGGDPRILFDSKANRWLAIGFGAATAQANGTNISQIQVAVSETDNALGAWHATSFTAYGGEGFGAAIADFPTLAITGGAILIGTNNFAPISNGGPQEFQGVTMSVLNKKALYAASGPTAVVTQFNTPYTESDDDLDGGYAPQGVNRIGGNGPATVVASSLYFETNLTYDIVNAGQPDAATTDITYLVGSPFFTPRNVRQPVTGANARVMTAGDERTGTNVWEVKGKLYFVTTVRPSGTDHDVVRVTVVDKATSLVLSETDIGGGASDHFDYSYGSIAVNSAGQIVVGYNRSGDITTGTAGRISIFARSFNTNADGTLTSTSGDILIKQSLVDQYHNGSAEGAAAVGRQRFGDYSTVTLDPTDNHRFWVIGEFAREYNNAAGGHPGGSGFGRWGTYVAQLGIGAVPEPATWAMMIMGFGFVGAQARRRRTGYLTA